METKKIYQVRMIKGELETEAIVEKRIDAKRTAETLRKAGFTVTVLETRIKEIDI